MLLLEDLPQRRLDAPRVALRLLQERDVAAVFAMFANPQMERFLSFRNWRSIDDARNWYQKAQAGWLERKLIQWMVVEQESDTVIGSCRLFGLNLEDGTAEIGYSLLPQYWGKGVMREALQTLFDFLFDELAMHRIEASADVRNLPSHKLLLAMGFLHEGTRRQCRIFKGEVIDGNVYGLLASDWRARNSRQRAVLASC